MKLKDEKINKYTLRVWDEHKSGSLFWVLKNKNSCSDGKIVLISMALFFQNKLNDVNFTNCTLKRYQKMNLGIKTLNFCQNYKNSENVFLTHST